MQTYTTKNKELDLTKLINNETNEPIIIKNNVGNQFLLMPFSGNKKLDIFLSLYKSFTELNKLAIENIQQQKELTEQELEMIEDKGMLLAIQEIEKTATKEVSADELNSIFNGDFITQ